MGHRERGPGTVSWRCWVDLAVVHGETATPKPQINVRKGYIWGGKVLRIYDIATVGSEIPVQHAGRANLSASFPHAVHPAAGSSRSDCTIIAGTPLPVRGTDASWTGPLVRDLLSHSPCSF